MSIPSIKRLLLASLVAAIGAVTAFPAVIRLEENTDLSAGETKMLLRALREAYDNSQPLSLPPALETHASDKAPLWLAAWSRGRQIGVWQAIDLPLKGAAQSLLSSLKKARPVLMNKQVSLQLVVARAESWIPEDGPFSWSAFVEGHDGISAQVGGTRIYLPPSELIRIGAIGQFKPVPWYESKFVFGLNVERAQKELVKLAGRLGVVGLEATNLRRFRGISAVEGPDKEPRLLLKTTVEKPTLSREALEQSVIAGADYLTRALKSNGSFLYEYLPWKGRPSRDKYNWPRHAGTTYSLAMVGRILKNDKYLVAARLALKRLVKQFKNGPDGSRCLFDKKKCYLGSSALGLLALAEYRIASGDPQFDHEANQLAAYIQAMQRDDGLFYHQWYPKTGIDRKAQKLYATQQAIFALARHAKAVGDPQYINTAERGMDFLAGKYWDHLLGTYFFIQEHWTCLAAEEMYNALHKPEYADICYNIGLFYDQILHNSEDTPWQEDAGGMAFTHMITPHTGGTATAAEASVSAILLGQAEGLDTVSMRKQLFETLDFLRVNQVTANDTFWFARDRNPRGGFYASGVQLKIRIDTVQHSISAMVRGLDLLEY